MSCDGSAGKIRPLAQQFFKQRPKEILSRIALDAPYFLTVFDQDKGRRKDHAARKTQVRRRGVGDIDMAQRGKDPRFGLGVDGADFLFPFNAIGASRAIDHNQFCRCCLRCGPKQRGHKRHARRNAEQARGRARQRGGGIGDQGGILLQAIVLIDGRILNNII